MLRPRDIVKRKVIDANGLSSIFHIRRLKCRDCGSAHMELPDFIVPYKNYSRSAIEMALNDKKSVCSAENSTIYRWGRERREKNAKN